jgi:NADH dehydrogenase FAD-containing subunit
VPAALYVRLSRIGSPKDRQRLSRRGITILENTYVKSILQNTGSPWTTGKPCRRISFFWPWASSRRPFLPNPASPPGPDGGLRVNRFLQSTQHPDIFGGGDCIYLRTSPWTRWASTPFVRTRCSSTTLSGPPERQELMPFDPGGDYLLIFNLGGRVGVLKKRWLGIRRPSGIRHQGLYRP